MSIPLETILIFIPIALALNITPGADMLFCLGQGAKSGPCAGVAAAFGIASGSFIHSLLAGLGLAVLIASHPLAFELLRWFGVSYLVYLAITSLKQPIANTQTTHVQKLSLYKAWRDGMITCLFNPKVAIFILALVPQFVDPANGSVLVQFLVFGAILNIGGTVINSLVGVFAGGIGRTLTRNRVYSRWVNYFTSALFVGLALRLALDKR